MDCQPPQPQAGKAVLKRSLEPTANLENSPAKSQQRAARLSSNAAGAAAQRPCNLDALPDDLFRGILDTLSKKDVGAAAATCKRFATAWRHAAGASAVLFPQLSAEGCATLRQFVGDAYAGGDDLSTEAGVQNFLVCTFPDRFDSQFQSKSCFDMFYGPPRRHFVDGLELKILHHDSPCINLDNAVAFWELAEKFPSIGFYPKDSGAHVAESLFTNQQHLDIT